MIEALRDRHKGQTANIVGCGPSIVALTAESFAPGPVIAVNHSILTVRQLHLDDVYSMQKVGCIPHGCDAPIPLGCVCPSELMVQPVEPEILLLSVAESSQCFPDYPLRYVFDTTADFGEIWCRSSVPMAVKIARLLGCTSLRMLGHDAYTVGDIGRVPGSDNGQSGYRQSGEEAQQFANDAMLPVEWVMP